MDEVFDICVVGSGMIGSAASRHITDIEDGKHQRILLIGPAEPKDRKSRDIFGAWYDEGRITRILDPQHAWCHLSQEAISGYKDLEQKSGIKFYSEAGYLVLGPKGCEYNENTKETAIKMAVSFDTMDAMNVKHKFPYIFVPDHYEGIFRKEKAGYISPRKLVHIQHWLASQNGCFIKDDIVCNITKDDVFILKTDKGYIYKANKVLLATGAFTSCRRLLPSSLTPKVTLASATVILVRISKKEAERLKNMPSFYIIKSDSLNVDKEDFDVYGIPPILYPDGCYYVKLGHGKSDRIKNFKTPQEIKEWFHGRGDPYLIKKSIQIFKLHFPDVKIEEVRSDNCVYTRTPTHLPYVDMLMPGLGIAIGGNGNGAKCSDEIGKMAAKMITNGKWSYKGLPAKHFRFQNDVLSPKL